jgi:predicted CoA-binding protein
VQKPKDSEETIRLAIQKGIKKIWMQKGAESETAVKLAKDAGITVITNKCILMYAYPSGFHKFHMRMTKLFGKY